MPFCPRQHQQAWQAATGVRVGVSTLHRVCQKLNWTLKKKAQRPIERNEAVRWQFLAQMQQRLGQNGTYRACPLDPHKVVLFDETGTRLGMTPARARSPKGERAHSPERRNTGTNHTLLSVVSLNGVLPDLLLEGGVNRLSFEFYLEHLLLPQMQPGSNPADSPHGAGWPAGRTGPIGAALSKTVPSCPRHMLDGYSTHLGGRVQKLVETQGCTLMYFLGYSPDPDGLTKNMRMRLYRANSSV